MSNYDSPVFDAFDDFINSIPEEPAPANVSAFPIAVNTIVLPAQDGAPSMSSLQIADITGKEHAHVMRDIRTILGEAGIGESKFGFTYTDTQNKERPCYLLPRRECDLVVSGYSVKYRLAIIDRWQELESKQSFKIPQSLPEALRLAADLSEELTVNKAALAIAAPKAAGLDRIASTEGSMNITAAAKTLGIPPQRLFETMACKQWIYRRGAEWLPFQDKQNAGLMTCKVISYHGSGDTEHTTTQARVTSKGLARLSALLSA